MAKLRKLIDISPPRDQEPPKKPLRQKGVSQLMKVILLLVLLVPGPFLLEALGGRVQVFVWPQTRLLSAQEEVQVEGKLFSKEKSLTRLYSASGKRLKETKAGGTIRVFNTQSKTQILVATTRFTSEEGKVFRSTARVSIAPNSSQDIAVVATEAGETYNIDPSNFSLPGLVGSPLYTAVYGKSFEPMKGGSREEKTVVSASDIASAKESLVKDLKEGAREALKEEIGETYSIEEKNFQEEVLSLHALVQEGAELEHFSVKGEVKVSILALLKDDIKARAQKLLEARLSKGEKLSGNVEVSWQTKPMALALVAKGMAYRNVDTQELKRELLNKSKSEGSLVLSEHPEIAKFRLSFFPFWMRSFPRNPEHIRMSLSL